MSKVDQSAPTSAPGLGGSLGGLPPEVTDDATGMTPSGYTELLEGFQRLQEENRSRTVALGTAAHQLKTPLAIISGYIELLLTKKPGAVNERQQQILQESQINCTRLRQYIEDFLSYSALETGKLALKYNAGDLNACLSELYSYWLSSFQKKGVALYLPVQNPLPTFAFDYDKLQHVVSNLLENALKFTPAGGTVWLTAEAHRWERRSQQDSRFTHDRRQKLLETPNAVRVSVSDTGPGVAPEYQQEIFDDFVKLPQPGDPVGGMGLGLAIARRLILAHNGKIWVESELGSGSTFAFLLPLKPL
ncbi:MAG: sensor histidine kinase [Terriglobia bacterium]